jgi:hypothetical protein
MNQSKQENSNKLENEYIDLSSQNESEITKTTYKEEQCDSDEPLQTIHPHDEMIDSLRAKLEVKALKTSLVSLSFLEGLFVSSNLVFFFIYLRHFDMSLPSYSLWEMFIFGIQIFNPVYGFIADSPLLYKGSKSKTLQTISVIGIFLYGLVAFVGIIRKSIIIYFLLHFLIEFLASFRCVIIDSFAAELNNMEKVFKRMLHIKRAQSNLKFVKTTLPMETSQNDTRNLISFSQSRIFQDKFSKIKKKSKLPSSAIKMTNLTPIESLRSKQIADIKKSNTKSNANLNTSILFGTKLVGKIISNALVGLGYQYLGTYFFLCYAFVYVVLFFYLCCCVPANSNINSTKEKRKIRFESARSRSLKEIQELKEQTTIDNHSNLDQSIKIRNNVLTVHSPEKKNEWKDDKLWPQIKSSWALIKEKKLVRLLAANAVFKISPSFKSSFDFFLLHILLFTSKEFSIQKILDSVCFFLGIILLNTLFRKFDNRKFLIFNGITYSFLIFILIFIVYSVFHFPQMDFFYLVLIYSSFHSLFFELLFIPIAGIFLDICPSGQEAFFMSFIFTLNSIFYQFGRLFGYSAVHIIGIHNDSYVRLPYLILVNFLFDIVACFILYYSFIPSKIKKQNILIIDKNLDSDNCLKE